MKVKKRRQWTEKAKVKPQHQQMQAKQTVANSTAPQGQEEDPLVKNLTSPRTSGTR